MFTFCNWNLNSLGKDNFSRIRVIQAQNSFYEYDKISLCETSLSDTVELPLQMLDNYTFISSNNQRNTKHGGVGIFYRNSLPIIVRNDLSFPESLVVEIGIGKKRYSFLLFIEALQTNMVFLNLMHFYKIFVLYMPILKKKSLLLYISLVILMATPTCGGKMVIPTMKAER